MRIEPLGDAAYIVRGLGDGPAYPYADELERMRLPGVDEVVPSYDTLGVFVDPAEFRLSSLEEALKESTTFKKTASARLHSVPVCYELGEDLESAAQELGILPEAVIEAHCSREYLCYAVGFCPGFPYLGKLPKEISGLPRLPAPRIVVPPGSVGVTGDQTGIYPSARPGGWRLIGATPLEIVSLEDAYFPIKAGDRVRFRPIRLGEYEAMKGDRL